MLISLGNTCATRYNIDIFNRFKYETNIFDWILVNIEAICIILKYHNIIDDIFCKDNIIKNGIHDNNSRILIKSFPKSSNKTYIQRLEEKTLLSSLPSDRYIDENKHTFVFSEEKTQARTCYAIPDLNNSSNFSNETIELEKNAYLISLHDIKITYTEQDILDFIEKYKRRLQRLIDIIKCKKEKLYFIYYGLISDEIKNEFIQIIKNINDNCDFILCSLSHNESDEEKKEDNFIRIHMKKYLIKEIDENWKKNYYDWNTVFKLILGQTN
jgi:hypothetical protein